MEKTFKISLLRRYKNDERKLTFKWSFEARVQTAMRQIEREREREREREAKTYLPR